MSPKHLDLGEIIAKARDSEGGETYINLHSSERGRLGLCVSTSEGTTDFILELLVNILGSGHRVDLDKIYHGLEIAQAAERQGFELSSQGDGWIYCHKLVMREDIESHCATVGRLIE